MGSYASMLNDTNWPVISVCISHLAGDNKKYLIDDSDTPHPAGDGCLLPEEKWNRGRDTLSLRLTGHGIIAGDYFTKKAFKMELWTGPWIGSERVHHISKTNEYKEVESYLNRITALKNATASGISYGEQFCEIFMELLQIENAPRPGSFISMIDENQSERGTVAVIKSVSEKTAANKVTVSATFGVFGGNSIKTIQEFKFEVGIECLQDAVNNRGALAFDSTRVTDTISTLSKAQKASKCFVMLQAATLLLDVASSVLSFLECPAPTQNYGVIASIIFQETSRAISEDNFANITADTATAITKLKDAMNHFKDKEKTYYVKMLMESEDHALKVYNRIAVIGFPPEFEWWRSIIYMQLATVRLISLLNLHVLEINDNSNNEAFLASARDCSEKVRITAASLVSDSKAKLLQWFKKDILKKFDSSRYEEFINVDHVKINVLKITFEMAWDRLLNLFTSNIKGEL